MPWQELLLGLVSRSFALSIYLAWTFTQWCALQFFFCTLAPIAGLFACTLNEFPAHCRHLRDGHPYWSPLPTFFFDPGVIRWRRNILQCYIRWSPNACLVYCPLSMLEKCVLEKIVNKIKHETYDQKLNDKQIKNSIIDHDLWNAMANNKDFILVLEECCPGLCFVLRINSS